MTKEEAIKYLQQLYPQGGHCWLDEQRIEAIGMAIKALQEEPVSEDYRERYKNITRSDAFKSAYENKSLGEVMSVEGEEPVSEEFEKTFISMVDATHENNGSYSLHEYAQRLYNIAKEELKEPVSDDLEEACEQLAENARKHKAETSSPFFSQTDYKQGVMDGTKWQKQQMMKDAIEAEIINWASMFTSIKVIEPERAEVMIKEKFDIGDKVKLIIVKED